MDKQPQAELGSLRQETADALSWQYILLIVIVALLIPLIVAVPVTIRRGIYFTSLDRLELTRHYDDPGGISVDYPDSWTITPGNPGAFMLTNDTSSGSVSRLPVQAAIGFQIALLADLQLPEDTVTTESTTTAILEAVLAQYGIESSEPVAEVTVAGIPGARAFLTQELNEGEVLFLRPDAETILIVQASVNIGKWASFSDPFNRILDTLTIHTAAE